MKTSEKLRLLADAVERTPDREHLVRSGPDMAFHMNHFGLKLFDNDGEGFNVCGTVCCALGIGAVAVPKFQEMGLRMYWSGPNDEYGTVIYDDMDEGYDAGREFFRISEQEAHRLFNPFCYESKDKDGRGWIRKEVVVGRIREMADRYENLGCLEPGAGL